MKFTVLDMTCQHCVKAITQQILNADPNAKVDIDLSTKSVEVQSTLSEKSIFNAIEEAGFDKITQN